MKTNKKETYCQPEAVVFSLKTQGIICQSNNVQGNVAASMNQVWQDEDI